MGFGALKLVPVRGNLPLVDLEILSRAELLRVDEDAHYAAIGDLQHALDERKMSVMQVAHRRYKSDSEAAGSPESNLSLRSLTAFAVRISLMPRLDDIGR